MTVIGDKPIVIGHHPRIKWWFSCLLIASACCTISLKVKYITLSHTPWILLLGFAPLVLFVMSVFVVIALVRDILHLSKREAGSPSLLTNCILVLLIAVSLAAFFILPFENYFRDNEKKLSTLVEYIARTKKSQIAADSQATKEWVDAPLTRPVYKDYFVLVWFKNDTTLIKVWLYGGFSRGYLIYRSDGRDPQPDEYYKNDGITRINSHWFMGGGD